MRPKPQSRIRLPAGQLSQQQRKRCLCSQFCVLQQQRFVFCIVKKRNVSRPQKRLRRAEHPTADERIRLRGVQNVCQRHAAALRADGFGSGKRRHWQNQYSCILQTAGQFRCAVLRIRHTVRGCRETQPVQLPQKTPLPQIAANDGK